MRLITPLHGRANAIKGSDPIPPGKWHTAGTTGEPNLESGWEGSLRFRLTNENQTEIQADISGGEYGTVVTLPALYRPDADLPPVLGAEGVWTLQADGQLVLAASTIDAAEDAIDAHIADTSDAHDASAISIADSGSYFTATDVEGALQELGAAGTTIGRTFIKRTGGDLTLTNDTNWHDAPTIGDLSIAAAAGDVLLITLDGVTNNSCRFEAKMVTSGNFAGPGETSTQGIAPWANRAGAASDCGGTIYYTVQSGDISSGLVAIRLRYTTNASGATTLFASTTVGPLTFGVINLG